MKVLTFKGGIHPDDKKSTSKYEIEILIPKKGQKMIYPMSQHIGAACTPIVSVGDYVYLGQKIGDSNQFMSSPIHTSVSGKVIDIGIYFTPAGVKVNSVVIENDGELTEHPELNKESDYNKLSKKEIIEKIKEAGIVGLGGAGFPTHVKLSPPEDKKIDYVIVNAAECEPYLTTDHRVLIEETEKIKIGLEIVLKLFDDAKGIIAIETNKEDAIKLMQEVCKDSPNIEVVCLEPKYPQGAEKQIILSCTKRQVPSGGLPADCGVIVNNVDTIIAIHRAIERGRPLMRKVITVAGGAIKNPGNYKIRLGQTYNDLIEEIGGFTEKPYKIIAGGPMMGVAMFNLDTPVTKTSSAIICLTEEEAFIPKESNCIRCANCVTYCPIGLMPLHLNQNSIRQELDIFEKDNGLDCIECGSCSYVCPSKRHLAQSIRSTRRLILGNKRV